MAVPVLSHPDAARWLLTPDSPAKHCAHARCARRSSGTGSFGWWPSSTQADIPDDRPVHAMQQLAKQEVRIRELDSHAVTRRRRPGAARAACAMTGRHILRLAPRCRRAAGSSRAATRDSVKQQHPGQAHASLVSQHVMINSKNSIAITFGLRGEAARISSQIVHRLRRLGVRLVTQMTPVTTVQACAIVTSHTVCVALSGFIQCGQVVRARSRDDIPQ